MGMPSSGRLCLLASALRSVDFRLLRFGIERLVNPDEIAANRPAAIGDAHLALLVPGQPGAERIGGQGRRDHGRREPGRRNDDERRDTKTTRNHPQTSCRPSGGEGSPRRSALQSCSRRQWAAGAKARWLTECCRTGRQSTAGAVQLPFIALIKPPFKSSDDYRHSRLGKKVGEAQHRQVAHLRRQGSVRWLVLKCLAPSAAPLGQGPAASDMLFELGMMYSVGRDVPVDLVSAHKWFNLAAVKGNADAGPAAARNRRSNVGD